MHQLFASNASRAKHISEYSRYLPCSDAIGTNPISYVLVWRNYGYSESIKKMHYYAPFKGQVSADDFIKFYELRNTFFGKDVAAEKLYQ